MSETFTAPNPNVIQGKVIDVKDDLDYHKPPKQDVPGGDSEPKQDTPPAEEGHKLYSTYEMLDQRAKELHTIDPDLGEAGAFSAAFQERRNMLRGGGESRMSAEELAELKEEAEAKGKERQARVEALVEKGMSHEGAVHQVAFEGELSKWRAAETEKFIKHGVEPGQAVEEAYTVAKELHGLYDTNSDVLQSELVPPSEIIEQGLKTFEPKEDEPDQKTDETSKTRTRRVFDKISSSFIKAKEFGSSAKEAAVGLGKEIKAGYEAIGNTADSLGAYLGAQLLKYRYFERPAGQTDSEYEKRCLRAGKTLAHMTKRAVGATVAFGTAATIFKATRG